ncbi:MAG: phosphatase PAP2 family protein [Bacteroidota bacterium]|nr:phosphatase PAP2 family protein [Bacteroidota bacterium]
MRFQLSLLMLFTVFYTSVVFAQVEISATIQNNASDLVIVDSARVTATVATPISSAPQNDTDKPEIYKLNLAVDIPLIAVTAGWSGWAFTKIYNKDRSTEEEIRNLDKADVPKIDRWVAGNSNEKAEKASDYLFYGSIPYVFTLFLDKEIRRDGFKVGLLYLEAMSITGLFYTGTIYFVDRYRPETYNTDLPVGDRTSGNYKDSFMGGHPALVATSTFFAASVYDHYHPESNFKYALYGVAIAATGTTAYLRLIAGKHFPTDLATGVAIGTLSGLLVPRFHKINSGKEQKLGLYPFGNGEINGLTAIYKF